MEYLHKYTIPKPALASTSHDEAAEIRTKIANVSHHLEREKIKLRARYCGCDDMFEHASIMYNSPVLMWDCENPEARFRLYTAKAPYVQHFSSGADLLDHCKTLIKTTN